MNKLVILSAAAAAIALAGASSSASAAVAPAAGSQVVAALDAVPGEIKLAHGWHRWCRAGYDGKWHYHQGYNTWYPCAPPQGYYGGGGGGGY